MQFHVENLDIRVEFHPDKLPGDIVWAVWDGMDGPIVEREHVTLDSQFAVHRYLRLAEKTTAGFSLGLVAPPLGVRRAWHDQRCAERRRRGDHEC